MTPQHLAAEKLFHKGEFAQLLASTPTIQIKRALEPQHRVLVANALALVGELDSSHELAELDRTDASLSVRSQAELTLGLITWKRGQLHSARKHLQTSVRFAHDSKDPQRIGWSHLYLFRLLVEGPPIDVVSAALPDVRRVVMRVGLPQVSAYMHLSVAVLEGQTGRLDEALRHCDAAESLLELSPNTWLLGYALLNRGCIACLKCNFRDAARYLNAAKPYATATGHAGLIAGTESTLGQIDLLTGEFAAAEQNALRVVRDPHTAKLGQVSASEVLSRIYLAQNRLTECEAVLRFIQAAADECEGIRSVYHVRWAGITKARHLLKQGTPAMAQAWLRDLATTTAKVVDSPFKVAIHLVGAQATGMSGANREAASHLLSASELGAADIPDMQGQYYYAAAGLLGANADLQDQLRQRAIRLWDHQGLGSIQLEMDRGKEEAGSGRPHDDSCSASTPSCTADALAAAIDLAYSPRLLGQELIRALQLLQCSNGAQVIETRGGGHTASAEEGMLALGLGSEGARQFTLLCPVPEDPAKAILLANVLRIARAALALAAARREERSRAALWPATPVEEEAGALFLAEEMRTLLATARRIAPTSVPLLITGETGTGKEVLARTIHGYSTRANATFLPFNCTGVPKDMLDSQLFGHRRGAFTGAVDHFPGVIRAAAGGTLFLDEIGETTLDVQPKLLRFLESSEVHPIGETQPHKVDVRVIAATNADLDTLVAQGRFREDLFYRLNIVRLHLPPLRERRVEIPAFANHYLQKHAKECQKGDLRLAEETMEYLVLYRWPGNVRQLANEMRRMAALAEPGAVLMPDHLSPDIAASRRTVPPSERAIDPNELAVRIDQPMAAAVEHVERALIQYALAKCGGRMEDTATILGLSRKGLYLKRVRYGLEPPESTAVSVA
jgi:DNA-binding NtrC family response regulator